MLKERVLSAIVMIIAVLAAIFLLSPLPLTLALAAVITAAMWEWAQFAGLKRALPRAIVAFVTVCLFILLIFANTDYIRAARFLTDETTPLLFISCIWWFIAFLLVVSYPKSANVWAKSIIAKFSFGFCTLVPFFIAALALRFNNYAVNEFQGTYLLLYVCLLVWGADSGAYFFGRAFGKRKLAPKVSPGKSWEGAIGGLITSCVIAFLFLELAPHNVFGRELATLPFILVSVATVAISVLGDLAESMFKRQANIKDSSNLIPGHGGILDRIDSLTAAIPFFATFFFFVL
ncbi:phosphatidate cytidylyltransferase [Actinobacillus equuli]|uniref:Phosphatidate cytidylyltransferase n=1 Tax=Actinobacillus equuli subsp. equuli TaxID=202947 RepID=A0A9X4JEB0_ACTEU|nr:phosphatidate cytidylyltransferase [Actinobacillus equuli]MDE8034920.1 phosphatidate cytidylyltransferase [Actinobacillus equuli subsp. equuli]MDG4952063.1 phosphatidate cytidylyltransferase [Actinobacillus equuli subsp. equuli]WGE49172.1 phosphatidate cytidylyltransferase [Actinobacillus equuli subsp. equuli]WGE51298.1 phosphatidate cytidylyltransferase [Actinobacillus equuli subsp. haemolyticus]WGE57640.1 phosphatidate cytidylyltransferase [Actinobacillus equuli subsp. equuli]